MPFLPHDSRDRDCNYYQEPAGCHGGNNVNVNLFLAVHDQGLRILKLLCILTQNIRKRLIWLVLIHWFVALFLPLNNSTPDKLCTQVILPPDAGGDKMWVDVNADQMLSGLLRHFRRQLKRGRYSHAFPRSR